MTDRRSLRSRLDFLLTRLPAFYALALSKCRHIDPDKILFLRTLRPGGVVIDGGANTGHYTRLFSHLVGKRGKVHAFEPAPSTFLALSSFLNVERRFDNVVTQNLALGRHPGEALLHTPGLDHGQASLTVHSDGSWSQGSIHQVRCTTTTVDDYVTRASLDRLDLIKLDIEGGELPALQGAAGTLSALRPALHIEVCQQWTKDFGYQPRDLVEFLAAHGYEELLSITPTGDLVPIDDPGLLESGVSVNIFCPAHRPRRR